MKFLSFFIAEKRAKHINIFFLRIAYNKNIQKFIFGIIISPNKYEFFALIICDKQQVFPSAFLNLHQLSSLILNSR